MGRVALKTTFQQKVVACGSAHFVKSYAVFADRICLSTLCERALSFTVSLREEGQVELLMETPNGLSACASLADSHRKCQHYFSGNSKKIRRADFVTLSLSEPKNSFDVTAGGSWFRLQETRLAFDRSGQ
jgi:hypothetical protein